MGRIWEELGDGKEYDKNMLCEILILMKGMWYTVRDLRRKEDGALGIYTPRKCHLLSQ